MAEDHSKDTVANNILYVCLCHCFCSIVVLIYLGSAQQACDPLCVTVLHKLHGTGCQPQLSTELSPRGAERMWQSCLLQGMSLHDPDSERQGHSCRGSTPDINLCSNLSSVYLTNLIYQSCGLYFKKYIHFYSMLNKCVNSSPLWLRKHCLGHEAKCLRTFQLVRPVWLKENTLVKIQLNTNMPETQSWARN